MRSDQMACPYCGAACDADFVHNGVGLQQCGPYYCERCGASEIGPFDPPRAGLTEREQEVGWYGPGQPISPLANQINGRPISHEFALDLYRAGALYAAAALPESGADTTREENR